MRTTLDIDDDVLAAAKDLARAQGKTMGAVMSDLARQALTAPHLTTPHHHAGFAEAQAQFLADDWLMFPPREGLPVTNDLIRQIQDDLDLEDAEAFDHTRNAPRILPQA